MGSKIIITSRSHLNVSEMGENYSFISALNNITCFSVEVGLTVLERAQGSCSDASGMSQVNNNVVLRKITFTINNISKMHF